jgi:hypothetical protein
MNKEIIALGEFLMNYEKDLEFIFELNSIFNGQPKKSKPKASEIEIFRKFLIDFNTVRSFKNDKTDIIFKVCKDYITTHQGNLSPDELASLLKTDKDINTRLLSLASKVIAFYDPIKYIPFDSLNRKAVGSKATSYCDFKRIVDGLKNDVSFMKQIKHLDSIVAPLVKDIEKNTSLKGQDFNTIRQNRLIDKFLRIQTKI